jgi:steroid Delta-isomerase
MSSADGASSVVDAYVRAVNAGDLEALIGLFTADAVLENALGTFRGLDGIAGFYRDVVLAGQAQVAVESVSVDGPEQVTAELTATSRLDPGGAAVRARDVFRLDPHGRIVRLEIAYL